MVKAIEVTLLVEVNEGIMSTRSPNTVKIGGNGPAWRVTKMQLIYCKIWAYLTLYLPW